MLSLLDNLLAPTKCISCKKYLDIDTILCNSCSDLIQPVVSISRKVSKNLNLIIHSLSDYKYPLNKLILAKNYSNYTIAKKLGYLLWERSIIQNLDFDYIIAVPLHWTRLFKRGYNQAEVMAKVLSKLSHKPIFDNIKRVKQTAYQAQIPGDMRKNNIAQAFKLELDNLDDLEFYKNKKFLLVDDLVTTGATLEELSKVLLKLNPKALYAISICRVL